MRKMLSLFFIVFLSGAYPAMAPAANAELVFSTYLGGSSSESAYDCALDSENYLYIVGNTMSSDFPTVGSYGSRLTAYTLVFVGKFSSSGSSLLYSTCLGGSDFDYGYGIAVDSDGTACIAGRTQSNDFPTLNPYQAGLAGSSDAFVGRLSSSGSSLIFSTYLGGTGGESGEGIALNSLGRVYLTGWTGSTSSDFPTKTAYQTNYAGGTRDAFVTKLDPGGSSLIFSTYLGGEREDKGMGIAIDSVYRACVTGWTQSENFPTRNPYQSSYSGGDDVFLTTFYLSGSSLLFSTYLGGSGNDRGEGVTLDDSDAAFIVGETNSSDFPTLDPYQAGPSGEMDVFFASFSASQPALLHSTYLGGSGMDESRDVVLDSFGRAYLIGQTKSFDFPTRNPYQASKADDDEDADDVFFSAFNPGGSALFYSTYLGGENYDWGDGIALGSNGTIYLTGSTDSSDFPTKNAFQGGLAGGADAFATAFRFPSLCRYHTDYDGDGTSDIAVFRESSGLWAIRGLTRIYFGEVDDEPVPGDYDADGTTDIGIFRPFSGLWAAREISRVYFGASGDEPVPADYIGDGTCNVAVFRPDTGLWALLNATRIYFGGTGDKPLPWYNPASGSMTVSIFRESSGLWALRNFSRFYFGASGDGAVPGDYDGEGDWEAAVFRPASGLWAVRGLSRVYFGEDGDDPLPADYNGSGSDGIGIFRDSTGLWAVKGTTRIYFGEDGDLPVTR